MVEMDNPENTDPRVEAQAYLAVRQQWMADATEVITGNREAVPSEVFPEPSEVRRESEGLELSPEQEAQLREVAGRFGVGGPEDVPSHANHQLIEGGLAWKIDAEAVITNPSGSVIFAGTPHRKITREDEVAYVKNRLGTEDVPENEYKLAKALAAIQPGFEPAEERVLPFGYDIGNGFALQQEATGQLVQIGTNNGRPVMVVRVDRENYTDEEGNAKYRNQPDSTALMGFIAEVLSATGDEISSVGLNTSNTYSSRVIDAVRAGLARNRKFDVGMYGRDTLTGVGAPLPKETEINQIPGELRTINDKLQHLAHELEA
jgi:hypothetical protein